MLFFRIFFQKVRRSGEGNLANNIATFLPRFIIFTILQHTFTALFYPFLKFFLLSFVHMIWDCNAILLKAKGAIFFAMIFFCSFSFKFQIMIKSISFWSKKFQNFCRPEGKSVFKFLHFKKRNWEFVSV